MDEITTAATIMLLSVVATLAVVGLARRRASAEPRGTAFRGGVRGKYAARYRPVHGGAPDQRPTVVATAEVAPPLLDALNSRLHALPAAAQRCPACDERDQWYFGPAGLLSLVDPPDAGAVSRLSGTALRPSYMRPRRSTTTGGGAR